MQIFDQNGWSQCSLFAIHILALLARTWHLHKLAWRTQRSPLSWQKFPRQQTSSTKDGRDIQHMQIPQGKGNWLPDWGCENCHTGSCTCNYLAWTSLCNTDTWRWSHGPLHSHKPYCTCHTRYPCSSATLSARRRAWEILRWPTNPDIDSNLGGCLVILC